MSSAANLPRLLERFFTERLMEQRRVSSHTIASYRDTFRLLLSFAQRRLHKRPSDLSLADLDTATISTFLRDLEVRRKVSARTRNLRLTAIRSFFRFAGGEEPAQLAHIQRVLTIPTKKASKPQIAFLTQPESQALLSVPDTKTWVGRRDRTLMLLALQTGLRLSELTSLDRPSVALGTGAHVRCEGKGRKKRCTPLTKNTAAVLGAWLKEPARGRDDILFPSIHGRRLSGDAVQYMVKKYVAEAVRSCPSLKRKRVSPHVLRHAAAMGLLEAGVDVSVIALWLGHESIETTQAYVHEHIGLKEAALAKTTPFTVKPARFRAGDRLLNFLNAL
jgi:integrase/recombinase XerD